MIKEHLKVLNISLALIINENKKTFSTFFLM